MMLFLFFLLQQGFAAAKFQDMELSMQPMYIALVYVSISNEG